MTRPPVWKKFECRGGARWTSVSQDYAGEVCTFSGCNCNGIVKRAGETTSREEAAAWFRRPGRDHKPFEDFRAKCKRLGLRPEYDWKSR